MKIFIIVVVCVLCLGFSLFVYLSWQSQSGKANGIVKKQLSVCPNKPNCVSSENNVSVVHSVNSIPFSDLKTDAPLDELKAHLLTMGAEVNTETNTYLAVIFKSKLFRFVDDLELRVDEKEQLVHVRSASRVGYSDRGVNKARVELLRALVR